MEFHVTYMLKMRNTCIGNIEKDEGEIILGEMKNRTLLAFSMSLFFSLT